MQETNHHRALDRIQIQGAKVFFRKVKNINFFHGFKGPYKLDDISKSNVRFQYPSIMLEDTLLELKIIIAESQSLRIKGKVVGPLDSKEYHRDHILVQFLPFGNRKVYNTYRSKRKLESILEEFDQLK